MSLHNTFTLILDTTAPRISWEAPEPILAGDTVTIPYSVDEEGVVEAAWVDYDGYEYPVTLTENSISFTTSRWTSLGHGKVVVKLRDDVLNERESKLHFEVRSHKFPIGAVLEDDGVYVTFENREVEVKVEP